MRLTGEKLPSPTVAGKPNERITKIAVRVKRILKIIGVNAFILGIGIVLIELMFGGWMDEDRLNHLNIIKGRQILYDVSHVYPDSNPTITYTRDAFGLRGSHLSPDRIDILTVGGSTADQRYIRDGETWQDVLQQKFEDAGEMVTIANAGVDGQSSYGHIKNFKWWFPQIPDLSPKYILFYVGLNDFHKDEGFNYDALRSGKSLNIGKSIKENSALWDLGRKIHGTWKAMVVLKIGHRSVDFGNIEWTYQALNDDYRFMQPRLESYADRLQVLADLTREFGSEPIFVSQPARRYRITPEGIEGDSGVGSYDTYEINGVDYYHMLRKLDMVTRAVADEKNAVFVDLNSLSEFVDEDFYDFSHMTPQGAEKIGSLMYEALKNVIRDTENFSPAKPEI